MFFFLPFRLSLLVNFLNLKSLTILQYVDFSTHIYMHLPTLPPIFFFLFIIWYFGCSMANFGTFTRVLAHSPDLVYFDNIWPKGQWEPCNKVRSFSSAMPLVNFEAGTYSFTVVITLLVHLINGYLLKNCFLQNNPL